MEDIKLNTTELDVTDLHQADGEEQMEEDGEEDEGNINRLEDLTQDNTDETWINVVIA